MSYNPIVSVVMSVFDTPEEWLRLSIESILNQTFRDIEFIIVIDCPTDNSRQINHRYHVQRPQLPQESLKGASRA